MEADQPGVYNVHHIITLCTTVAIANYVYINNASVHTCIILLPRVLGNTTDVTSGQEYNYLQ